MSPGLTAFLLFCEILYFFSISVQTAEPCMVLMQSIGVTYANRVQIYNRPYARGSSFCDVMYLNDVKCAVCK